MGSLATHMTTFLILYPIGIKRLYTTLTHFLKDPSHYHSKPWFFSNENRLKSLDFYALLVALPIASLTDIFIFLSFSGHPTYRFSFFMHGAVVFLFWVVLVLIILKESFDLFDFHEGLVFALCGFCFLIEYMIGGSGGGFVGVSKYVYDLVGYLTLLCAFSCIYLSVKGNSFLGDFGLCCGIMFKATWVLQAGLNLYTNVFGLKGCHGITLLNNDGDGMVDVKCDLDEDRLRGMALMNLLFVGHAIVHLLACLGLFVLLSFKRGGLRFSEGSGPLLARVEAHSTDMKPVFELEMD